MRPTTSGCSWISIRHEVAVLALVDPKRLGGDGLACALHHGAGGVAELGALAGEDRPIALVEIGDGIGEGGEREGVGAEIVSPCP